MMAGNPSAAICRSSSAWRTPCIATRSYFSLTVVSTPTISASPWRRASHTAKALSLPELQETNARGAMACYIPVMFPAQRIVCLTEETVETLYLLGEQDRIAGISGYCVRPPQARKQKPRVSAFTSADIPKILALEPDLVLAFSDLQADIVAALIRASIAIHVFNQRDVAGILAMIRA